MERGSEVAAPPRRRTGDLDRLLMPAALAGMLASMLGAMAGMIATALAGSGFYTLLYGAVSTLAPETLALSIQRAAGGEIYLVDRVPMVCGAALFLAVGGLFGMLFVAIGRVLPARSTVSIPVGMLYGYAVLALITLIGLPRSTRLVAAGRPVDDMSAAMGWVALLLVYGVYGAVLGLWVARRPQDLRPPPPPDPVPADRDGADSGQEGRAES